MEPHTASRSCSKQRKRCQGRGAAVARRMAPCCRGGRSGSATHCSSSNTNEHTAAAARDSSSGAATPRAMGVTPTEAAAAAPVGTCSPAVPRWCSSAASACRASSRNSSAAASSKPCSNRPAASRSAWSCTRKRLRQERITLAAAAAEGANSVVRMSRRGRHGASVRAARGRARDVATHLSASGLARGMRRGGRRAAEPGLPAPCWRATGGWLGAQGELVSRRTPVISAGSGAAAGRGSSWPSSKLMSTAASLPLSARSSNRSRSRTSSSATATTPPETWHRQCSATSACLRTM
eukprot:scaffold23232_cov131-Isochrysis_galbana.AAC.9